MEQTLNSLMEFDHVILVHPAGTITEPDNVHPYLELSVYKDEQGEWYDSFYLSEGWELLKGFSGQYGYSGPVMHASEYVGGGLERHIRETPGYYVVTAVETHCLGTEEGCDTTDGCHCEPAGWAVAYKPVVMVKDVYHYGNVRTVTVEPLEAVEARLMSDAMHGATRDTLTARQANVRKAIATLQETGTDNSWGWHTLTVVESGE